MTLPFATPVSLNTDPTVIGVVVGVSSSTREGYAVAWPNGTRETRWRAELTVVQSPADVALSEIAALLGLPPDAEPKTVVDAFKRGALREAMRPPMEIKITSDGEARMVMESAFARTLRVVSDLNPNGQDFVWGHIDEDGKVSGVPRPAKTTVRRDTRGRPLRYVIGPDPALLVGVA